MITVLKILILGGTSFLGPHLVHELQQHGHEITIFTRGNQIANFSNVEQLQGDRDGDLNALKDRKWDAIIDTSGNLPRLVTDSSILLTKSTQHYTFISTIGVYQDFHNQKIDEKYPVAKLENENDEEITEKTYGALKAACEERIQEYFPDRCLIVRPGLIVGPLDPTDRLSYWPIRANKGGEILAPGSPSQALQFIDVRDLAQWIVAMIEQQVIGIYNVTGPETPIDFEQFLHACKKMSNNDCFFTWVSEDFLIEHQVQDWTELPLWLSYKRNMPGFLNVSIEKALQAGLTLRPLSDTLTAIIAWDRRRKESKRKNGLDPEKERDLLNRWNRTCSHMHNA